MWGDAVGRPGVMIYFDIRKALNFLTDQQKGRLFQAILDYAEQGSVPQFDGVMAMAWAFVQPQLDRDGERYAGKVVKTKYAVYVREAKKKDEQPMPFEEWRYSQLSSDDNEISDGSRRYPTTNTITTPITATTPVTATTPITATTQTQHKNGEQEENRRCFTENQSQKQGFIPPTVDEVRTYCNDNNFSFSPERFVDYYQAKGWMISGTVMMDWKAAARIWERKEKQNERTGKTSDKPAYTIGTVV